MNSLVQDRTRIAELNAEREVIRDAPLSRAETTSAITAWCAEQAGELETRIRYRVNQVAHGDDLQGLFVVQPMTPGGKIDMVSLVAALFGPQTMADALCGRLDPDTGMSRSEKLQRLQSIDEELDALERREEAAVVRSELEGRPIARRADARPEIVLALADEDPHVAVEADVDQTEAPRKSTLRRSSVYVTGRPE